MKRWLLPLLVWNGLVFALFAYDKWAARTGRRRVPERTLLACTFAFGTLGAMAAMRVLSHKTRKTWFGLLVSLSLFTSLALVFVVFVR